MWLSESHQQTLPLSLNAEVLQRLQDPQLMASLASWITRDVQARLEVYSAQQETIEQGLVEQESSAPHLRVRAPERPAEPPPQVKLTELPGVELTVEIWGLDRCCSFEEPPPTLERPPSSVVEVMRPIGALASRWSVLYGDGSLTPPTATTEVPPPQAQPAMTPAPNLTKAPSGGFGSWLNAPPTRPSAQPSPTSVVALEPPPPQVPVTLGEPAPQLSPALPVLPPSTPPSSLPSMSIESSLNSAEAFAEWSAYERRLSGCYACPRSQERVEREWVIVNGVGSRTPTVLFVESHPSEYALTCGLPFAEPQIAQQFSKTLTWLGLSRHRVYTTSLLKCGLHDPSPAEWEACRTHFETELRLLQPKLIVALGALTTQILLNKPSPLVGEWSEVSGIPMIGTHHFRDAVTPNVDRLKRSMGDHLRRFKERLRKLEDEAPKPS